MGYEPITALYKLVHVSIMEHVENQDIGRNVMVKSTSAKRPRVTWTGICKSTNDQKNLVKAKSKSTSEKLLFTIIFFVSALYHYFTQFNFRWFLLSEYWILTQATCIASKYRILAPDRAIAWM